MAWTFTWGICVLNMRLSILQSGWGSMWQNDRNWQAAMIDNGAVYERDVMPCLQQRSQALKSGWAQGAWGTEVPQRGPEAEPRWGSGGKAPRSQIYTNNLQLSNAFLCRSVAKSVLHLPLTPHPEKKLFGSGRIPPVARVGAHRGYATGLQCHCGYRYWSFNSSPRLYFISAMTERTMEHWIQRITFAAESNAADTHIQRDWQRVLFCMTFWDMRRCDHVSITYRFNALYLWCRNFTQIVNLKAINRLFNIVILPWFFLLQRDCRFLPWRWLSYSPNLYIRTNFPGGLRKTRVFWNRVHNGPSRSSKVVDFGTNRKRVCDFLLVINCNLGNILPRFRDIAGFLLRTSTPAQFHPNFGGVPLGLDWCCGFDERRP